MTRITRNSMWMVVLAVALTFSPARAQQPRGAAASPSDKSAGQSDFERAYYLQTHDGNWSEAAAIYERIAADNASAASLRADAAARLAICRENLATVDLARLMPPEAMVYIELSQPGEQLTRLVKMLGLVREPDASGSKPGGVALHEGLYFPDDFSISPALLVELKKIRGAAVALTGVSQNGEPEGLLVLHPGDSNLLRGILETAIQVLEPAEPIEGFKTYRDPSKGWITATSQLFLVARSREQLTAAVARLRDPKGDSLGSLAAFQTWRDDRQDALLFVHVDGQRMVKQLGPYLRDEQAAKARAVLDLDHLDSLTAALRATDDNVELRAQLNLKDGHHNLLYSLIRTAPFSRRSLDAVPQGVAAVALIGLNPPSDPVVGNRATAEGGISAIDLGREIFANIEEFALFALPPGGPSAKGPPIPEVGLVLAVKDASKSQALWNQLLALPAMLGAPGVEPGGEIQIEGQKGQVYKFDRGPSLVVVPSSAGSMLIGTEAAVTASLKAIATKSTIASDSSFQPLLNRLTANSSKAVWVDLGRVAQAVLSGFNKPNKEAAVAGMIFKDLKVSAVTDEGPNHLGITAQATGLPNLPSLIKLAGRGSSVTMRKDSRVESRKQTTPSESFVGETK